jgi:threonine/homoserine/homoserine lactone efflux protein
VAILLASEPVFRGVKLLGAAYLVLLWARSLAAALRPTHGEAEASVSVRPAPLGAAAAYRQGLLNNLGNFKMAVFFASILPQFAAPGQGMLSGLVLLGVVFSGSR